MLFIRKQTSLWRTEGGEKIRICDMSDNHLNNTIAMVDRYKIVKEAALIRLGYETLMTMRGEMTVDSIERGLDALEQCELRHEEVHPLYQNLLMEQERRKLMEKDKTTDEKATYTTTHKFFIAGVQHHQMHKVLDDLAVGTYLQLVAEPTNKFDPNAVRIEFEDVMCGYVPKKFSSEVSAAFEIGTTLVCEIVELDKKAKPWEQCKVEIREVPF